MRWESSRHLRLRRGDKRSQGTTIWRTKRKRPDPGLHGSWLSQRAGLRITASERTARPRPFPKKIGSLGWKAGPLGSIRPLPPHPPHHRSRKGLANMEVRMSPHPSVGLTHQKLLANEQRHDSARGGGELQRPARNGHIA